MSHVEQAAKKSRKRRCQTGVLASDITREMAEQWFHLPSHEASAGLGISLSVLKRVCRRLGIPRWPYRVGAKPSKPGQVASQQAQASKVPFPGHHPAAMPSTPAASTRTGQRGMSPQPHVSYSSGPCSPCAEKLQGGPSRSSSGGGTQPQHGACLEEGTAPASATPSIAALLSPAAATLHPAGAQRDQHSRQQEEGRDVVRPGSTQESEGCVPNQPQSGKSVGRPWQGLPSEGSPYQQDPMDWAVSNQTVKRPWALHGLQQGLEVPAAQPLLQLQLGFSSAPTSAFQPWHPHEGQQQQGQHLPAQLGQQQQQQLEWQEQGRQPAAVQGGEPAPLYWECVRERYKDAPVAEASLDPKQGISPAVLAGLPGAPAAAPACTDFAFAYTASAQHSSGQLRDTAAQAAPPQASFRTAAAAFYPLGIPGPEGYGLRGWGGPSGCDSRVQGGSRASGHTVCLPRSTNGFDSVLVEVQQRACSHASAGAPLDEALLAPSGPPSPLALPTAASADSWCLPPGSAIHLPRPAPSLPPAPTPPLPQQLQPVPQQAQQQQQHAFCAHPGRPAQAAQQAGSLQPRAAPPASINPMAGPTKALARLLHRGAGLVASQPDHPLAAQLRAAVHSLGVRLTERRGTPGGGEALELQRGAQATPKLAQQGQQAEHVQQAGQASERAQQQGQQAQRQGEPTWPWQPNAEESRRRVRQRAAWECLHKCAAKHGYRIEGVQRVSCCTAQLQ